MAVCVFLLPPLLVPATRPPAAAVAPLDRLRLENDRVKLRNEARATLLQAFGGTFFLVTALLTWRQIQVTREGQLTDRFTRAIEHLGTEDKLEVRLGGIYALERIANDSGGERDGIAEILAAFVRRGGQTIPPAGEEDAPELPPLRVRAPDLQAAMTVLGRRPPADGGPLQLAGVDLRKAMLAGANLRAANLAGADLSGADLRGCDLREADLRGAQLRGADLTDARLAGASLGQASLWVADLTDADLDGADLEQANLRGACLVRSNFDGAVLGDANLGEARLQEATLRDAHLQGANLWGASLDGAVLVGASLERADLAGARADPTTIWPNGFDWRSAGVLVEDRPPRLVGTRARPGPGGGRRRWWAGRGG